MRVCKRGNTMSNMKKMIVRYMQTITLVLISLILIITIVSQILSAQRYARETAAETFVQIRQIMQENETELTVSKIFSLLRVNTGVQLYAIDKESGEIKGATSTEDVGKDCEELGFLLEEIESRGDGYHATIKGLNSFCVFAEIDGNLIGRVVPAATLYHNIQINACAVAIYLIIIAVILIVSVTRYLDKTVIKGIEQINGKLGVITEGNLDETVDVQTCLEFAELSRHSNEMIKTLLSGTDKISYVLNKTDVPIGVYEYNTKMTKVRHTEHVPGILSLKKSMAEELFADSIRFADYIKSLKQNPVDDEDDIYCMDEKEPKYIRLEELTNQNDVFGIIIDVTEEITKRKQIEAERDTDILTGLFNRCGLENRLEDLFEKPDKLKNAAMVMVDADCLKEINDKYGHDKGDIYLCKIAGVLSSFGPNSCVISRYGGDEFVLFLYEYENVDELENTVKTLGFIQDNSIAHLSDKISVPLKFSYGYCLYDGKSSYEELLKIADDRMYENKKARKTGR